MECKEFQSEKNKFTRFIAKNSNNLRENNHNNKALKSTKLLHEFLHKFQFTIEYFTINSSFLTS